MLCKLNILKTEPIIRSFAGVMCRHPLILYCYKYIIYIVTNVINMCILASWRGFWRLYFWRQIWRLIWRDWIFPEPLGLDMSPNIRKPINRFSELTFSKLALSHSVS